MAFVRFAPFLLLALSACSSPSADDKPAGGQAGSVTASGGHAMGGAPGNISGATSLGGNSAGGSSNAGVNAGGTNTPGGAANGGAATAGAAGAGTACGAAVPAAVSGLAFPEAQGFGQHATGGRDGMVFHVSNLNDAGTGSFRDAVSQSNRIVVFDVGGYITLKTAVSVKSNLTIAGQTAPGGGIGFRGGEISFAGSSNIIMRHVRIRPGDETASTEDDALSLYRAKNVVVDHCSLAFAPWNNIDGVSDDWEKYPVTDITFQDSLIADPTGQQFGAHTESVASQWSWYRNVFANSHNRNPLAKVDNVFVNNVLYNCSAGYTTHTSTAFKHDIVNNYFIFGPASTGTDNTWYQIDKNQSIYYAGNLKDNNLNGMLDGAATTPNWYQGPGTILNAAWSPANSANASDAKSAYRIGVSQAGALPRDEMDALVISQVTTLGKGTTGTAAGTVGPGGGLYTSQTQTGLSNNGYGDIKTAAPAVDTDKDGMPDFWEKAAGSNTATDDALQKASDGYLLLEHYHNWLAEPHATATAGGSVDVDLASYTLGFSDVTPTFTVKPGCGSVQLLADKHTAHFTAAAGFVGLASFDFTVTGSDTTTFTSHVAVAVSP
jgi:pectate lyase